MRMPALPGRAGRKRRVPRLAQAVASTRIWPSAPPLLSQHGQGFLFATTEAIAVVVFDLDGVLIDSESVWDAARREVVARNGGPVTAPLR
jgi:hypothetical protein